MHSPRLAETGGPLLKNEIVYPQQRAFRAKGARIAYFEWGAAHEPPVLLLHATGFHARVWDETVRALGAGWRVIAVDLRGHGRSEKTGPMPDWSLAADDVAELVAHLRLERAIGVGHSMGGHVLVQVAARLPAAFARLVLVDPVIMTPEIYANPSRFQMPPGQVHPVAKRRNNFASAEEMIEAFANRPPYAHWRRAVLEDYCRYGLLPAQDGAGFVLACPPAIEASIYTGSAGADVYALVRKVDVPVAVLRAKPRDPHAPRDRADFSASPTWEKLAGLFPRGLDVPLYHLSHFIPMEQPDLVARYIRDYAGT